MRNEDRSSVGVAMIWEREVMVDHPNLVKEGAILEASVEKALEVGVESTRHRAMNVIENVKLNMGVWVSNRIAFTNERLRLLCKYPRYC